MLNTSESQSVEVFNTEYLMEFNIKTIHEQSATIVFPGSIYRGIHTHPGKTIFAHLNHNLECDKTTSFTNKGTPEVFI